MKYKYLLCKFVEANTVEEALRMDCRTPVHECRIDDDDKGSDSKSSLIGFAAPADEDAPYEMRKRRNGRRSRNAGRA